MGARCSFTRTARRRSLERRTLKRCSAYPERQAWFIKGGTSQWNERELVDGYSVETDYMIDESADLHPWAEIGRDVVIGSRTRVWQFASVIRCGAMIGDDCR